MTRHLLVLLFAWILVCPAAAERLTLASLAGDRPLSVRQIERILIEGSRALGWYPMNAAEAAERIGRISDRAAQSRLIHTYYTREWTASQARYAGAPWSARPLLSEARVRLLDASWRAATLPAIPGQPARDVQDVHREIQRGLKKAIAIEDRAVMTGRVARVQNRAAQDALIRQFVTESHEHTRLAGRDGFPHDARRIEQLRQGKLYASDLEASRARYAGNPRPASVAARYGLGVGLGLALTAATDRGALADARTWRGIAGSLAGSVAGSALADVLKATPVGRVAALALPVVGAMVGHGIGAGSLDPGRIVAHAIAATIAGALLPAATSFLVASAVMIAVGAATDHIYDAWRANDRRPAPGTMASPAAPAGRLDLLGVQAAMAR